MVNTRIKRARAKNHADEDHETPTPDHARNNVVKSVASGSNGPLESENNSGKISHMMQLPTEMLLVISSYLSHAEIRNFCNTSKFMSKNLTPTLYQRISVGPKYLPRLTRTILDHPELSQWTRELKVSFRIDEERTLSDDSLALHPGVKRPHSEEDDPWKVCHKNVRFLENLGRFLLNDLSKLESLDILVPEYFMFTGLDSRHLNLRRLRIRCGTVPRAPFNHKEIKWLSRLAPSLTYLDLEHFGTTIKLLTSLPPTLKELRYVGSFDRKWGQTLENKHGLLTSQDPISNLTNLTLDEQTFDNFPFSRLPQLKYITVCYGWNMSWDLDELVQRLSSRANTLRSLRFRPYIGHHLVTPYSIADMPSMNHFVNLEELMIPAISFTKRERREMKTRVGVIEQPSKCLMMLPTSISSLVIIHDCKSLEPLLRLLAQMSGENDHGCRFPKLRSVLIATTPLLGIPNQEILDLREIFAGRNIQFSTQPTAQLVSEHRIDLENKLPEAVQIDRVWCRMEEVFLR